MSPCLSSNLLQVNNFLCSSSIFAPKFSRKGSGDELAFLYKKTQRFKCFYVTKYFKGSERQLLIVTLLYVPYIMYPTYGECSYPIHYFSWTRSLHVCHSPYYYYSALILAKLADFVFSVLNQSLIAYCSLAHLFAIWNQKPILKILIYTYVELFSCVYVCRVWARPCHCANPAMKFKMSRPKMIKGSICPLKRRAIFVHKFYWEVFVPKKQCKSWNSM